MLVRDDLPENDRRVVDEYCRQHDVVDALVGGGQTDFNLNCHDRLG